MRCPVPFFILLLICFQLKDSGNNVQPQAGARFACLLLSLTSFLVRFETD